MKIIQIAVTQRDLIALTDDGKLYQLIGGNEIGFKWLELPPITEPHLAFTNYGYGSVPTLSAPPSPKKTVPEPAAPQANGDGSDR